MNLEVNQSVYRKLNFKHHVIPLITKTIDLNVSKSSVFKNSGYEVRILSETPSYLDSNIGDFNGDSICISFPSELILIEKVNGVKETISESKAKLIISQSINGNLFAIFK